MKKLFKILGILLIVLALILIIYFMIIHFHGFLDKENTMSREETIKLLEKGKEYPNYYFSSQNAILGFKINSENKTEYFIKDNIVKCVNNGQISEWTDYNNDEKIMFMGGHASINSLENHEENPDEQRGFDYSLIAREEIYNNDFEYLGEKIYEERKTILVKVWNKDDLKINSTIFYIDKDTGLVMRRIDYIYLGLIKMDCDRNVKLDIVTDSDIAKPNLEGYNVLENK